MIRVEVALSATHDRDEVLSFLKAPSAAGDRFISDLQGAIEHLEHFPNTAVKRRDLTRFKVLFWLAPPYFLVLERSSEVLSLIAILHSSRNIRRELRQRFGDRKA